MYVFSFQSPKTNPDGLLKCKVDFDKSWFLNFWEPKQNQFSKPFTDVSEVNTYQHSCKQVEVMWPKWGTNSTPMSTVNLNM